MPGSACVLASSVGLGGLLFPCSGVSLRTLFSHLLSLSAPECFCLCSDLKLRVRILIDGTLIIFRVKPEDAGKYTCVPSNSLGRSPSASAYLTVQCESGREIPGGWCIQRLQALDPDWRLEGSRDRVWAQGAWAEWLEGRRNIPRGGGLSWPIR